MKITQFSEGIYNVTLNGKPFNFLAEADDEEGYIVRYTGEFDASGNAITERLYGKVVITPDYNYSLDPFWPTP